MSGLEKMKARIIEEAEDSAREIISQADAQAEDIVGSARKGAEEEARQILEQAEKDAAEYGKRTKAALDMQRKQLVLRAKQEMIAEVIDQAYDKVLNLGEKEYFGLMRKLLEKYILPGEGVICFSKKDLERMPTSFRKVIEETASEAGASLSISGQPEQIDGGFLLVYGGIEENCTIRALFDEKKEELSDMANRCLFGKCSADSEKR